MTVTQEALGAREVADDAYPLRERVAHAIFMRAATRKDEQQPSYAACLDLADAAISAVEYVNRPGGAR